MTIQEMFQTQERIEALAKKIPEQGFDWGDDQVSIKELVRLLVKIAQEMHLGQPFVQSMLNTIATTYKWNIPAQRRWLLDACAMFGWKEFATKPQGSGSSR